MTFRQFFAGLALAGAAILPAHAGVQAIGPDGSWHPFDVDDLTAVSGGLEWIDLADGSALSFTVNLSQGGTLLVVDAGFAGDRFQVFDNAVALGTTSVATDSYPSSVGTDFDAAWANPAYSKATYTLAPGSHTITGLLSSSVILAGEPLNATVGAVMIQAVPEPAEWLITLLGLGMLSMFARRRAA